MWAEPWSPSAAADGATSVLRDWARRGRTELAGAEIRLLPACLRLLEVRRSDAMRSDVFGPCCATELRAPGSALHCAASTPLTKRRSAVWCP